MATTRKHFEHAAAYIKRLHTSGDFPGGDGYDPGPFAAERAEAAYAVCLDLFRWDNPNFDAARFRLACGLKVGG